MILPFVFTKFNTKKRFGKKKSNFYLQIKKKIVPLYRF